jgi:hypothetical protein
VREEEQKQLMGQGSDDDEDEEEISQLSIQGVSQIELQEISVQPQL